ncbi:hypothetical protein COT62_03110 [Candidatus Roizmanbacteria bacterium CG09_land_8_20_14_0_10_41_9]|uniref:ABC3 transporter permease protein domain-containing protein n=1 Tax=Candidatus Roizmanbacteria bacterium CG09_land_8_20_14_0_10_41_9 TaxID=1974850 RepID=A0A2H0WSE5_9BACT|nr:MAG: hypothetical protein COT62_03110 [Candidatus Roizmanbacteria bacterium CG09_land_8_20_14_0_10_41_9]
MKHYFIRHIQEPKIKTQISNIKMKNLADSKIRVLLSGFWQMIVFALYILVYMFSQGIKTISNSKILPRAVREKLNPFFLRFYLKMTHFLDSRRQGSIGRMDLIELSIRNMKAKKTRTMVTIGGVTIGIAAIVFLVSVGYGLEQLIISRVTRLEEMKQADILPQAGGKIKIDDKTISNFKEISSVEAVLPLIAVVGRISYQNSVTDLAVYGVTSDYLKQSAIKPNSGKIFESNDLVSSIKYQVSSIGEVAGTETGAFGEKIQDVEYSINPGQWIRVRENPNVKAKILGYTKRVEGSSQGEEVWGSDYAEGGNKWLKTSVFLWQKEGGEYLVLKDEQDHQVQKEGYFAEVNITIEGSNIIENGSVLGINDNNALDWVEIASEAGITSEPETKQIELSSAAVKQAVVNRATLKVLGIKEGEALGKKFNVSFVVVGDLLPDPKEKLESVEAEYTIIGVTPEEKTPVFYVPFLDLRTLGITNYSQIKLVAKNSSDLAKIRKQVEAMGYITHSVADTVEQIKQLFGTTRTILALLGMVALAVAALGMFNTLTVSLLERTREVGLMKAMGMKSAEVQELFLTESMIMGFFGGMLGIIVGFVLGKLLGLLLSLFAVFKGVGLVDVAYLPFPFVLLVVFLSLLVGMATGIYPAKRATKISALNALRYE